MAVIPNALRSVFHHKKPCVFPRASSVCGSGSRGVACCGTEPACNGSIPPVQNWWSAFLSGRQVKGAPAGSMHTVRSMKGGSELCEIH